MYCRFSVAVGANADFFQILVCAGGIQPVTSAWVSIIFGGGGFGGVQAVHVGAAGTYIAIIAVVVEKVPVPFFLLAGRRVRLTRVWIDDIVGIGKLKRWALGCTLKSLIISPAGGVAKECCLFL